MNKSIYDLLSLSASVNNYYNDLMYIDNPKLLSLSVNLVIEIAELLENNYTYEDIIKLINESDFNKKDNNLTDEEVLFLKQDAIRILNIRYDIYNSNKEKIKKHLL